jgi:hypothetical protein
MLNAADRAETPPAIRTNLAAIFVSLELSRSVWLITSLSPGSGEKMSKRSVAAGDIAALLARFGKAERSTTNRASPKPAIRACERPSSSLPGYGCVINQSQRWPCGSMNGSTEMGAA